MLAKAGSGFGCLPYESDGAHLQGQNAVGTHGDEAVDLCEKAVAADVQDRGAGAEALDEKL